MYRTKYHDVLVARKAANRPNSLAYADNLPKSTSHKSHRYHFAFFFDILHPPCGKTPAVGNSQKNLQKKHLPNRAQTVGGHPRGFRRAQRQHIAPTVVSIVD